MTLSFAVLSGRNFNPENITASPVCETFVSLKLEQNKYSQNSVIKGTDFNPLHSGGNKFFHA